MKTVIIVSKCLRVTKYGSSENWYEFHFRGVCAGHALKKVMLRARDDFQIQRGVEYLMSVQLISMEDGVLKGVVIKLKRLDECWDRS